MDTLRDTLSERQRAMLAEMGIRTHWLPRAKARPAKEKGPCQPGAAAPEARAAAPVLPPPAAARAEAAPAGPKAPARTPETPETPGTPEAPKAPARPEAPAASAQAVADMDWPALQTAVAQCQACGLCETRRQTVFGAGARQARWMVVGEAPGEQEDRQGQPFVGPAGKLLDAMLAAMGLSRHADDAIDALEKRAGQTGQEGQAGGPPAEGVYIANVLKCRPPANRNPQPDEVARCEPYLRRQVALVQPARARAPVRGRARHRHLPPVLPAAQPARQGPRLAGLVPGPASDAGANAALNAHQKKEQIQGHQKRLQRPFH